MADGDGLHDISRVEQGYCFVLVKGDVHQAGGLIEPVRAVEHYADDAHAATVRAENQASSGFLGVTGFDAGGTLIGGEELVFVVQHPVIAAAFPGDGGTVGADDLPEDGVGHGFPGDECQIMGGGVVSLAGQPVGCEKYSVCAAQFSGTGCHHVTEICHCTADVLGNGGGCVVAGGQHQPIEHLPQGEGFALCQVDAGTGDAKGIAAAGDGCIQVAQFNGKEGGHHLGGGGHGKGSLCVVADKYPSAGFVDDDTRLGAGAYFLCRNAAGEQCQQERRQQTKEAAHYIMPWLEGFEIRFFTSSITVGMRSTMRSATVEQDAGSIRTLPSCTTRKPTGCTDTPAPLPPAKGKSTGSTARRAFSWVERSPPAVT